MKRIITTLIFTLCITLTWAQNTTDGYITLENMGQNNDVLPQLKVEEGEAVVKMQVLNYKGNGGEPANVVPRLCTEWSSHYIERGEASTDGTITMRVKMPYAAAADIMYNGKSCGHEVLIAPGETLELLIDDSKEDGNIVVGCKGFLARTNLELCNKSIFDIRKSYDAWVDSLSAKIKDCYANGQPQDLLDIFDKWYEDRVKETKARNNSDVAKALWQCYMDAQYISFVSDYGAMLEYWLEKREYNNDRTAQSTEGFRKRFNELFDRNDIIRRIKDKNMLSLTDGTMPLMYSRFAMDRYLGAGAYDEIFCDDLMHDYAITWELEGRESLSEKDFNRYRKDDFRNLMMEKMQARINAKTTKPSTEKTGGVYFATYDDVAPENILQTILDKYKGRIVVIDQWETWCGPCLEAHKMMANIKAELTDKDIVFVYIASSLSDIKKWNELIPNISGEHYCVTKEQTDYIMDQHKGTGFPTFAIYNKEGHLVQSYVGGTAPTAVYEKLLGMTK